MPMASGHFDGPVSAQWLADDRSGTTQGWRVATDDAGSEAPTDDDQVADVRTWFAEKGLGLRVERRDTRTELQEGAGAAPGATYVDKAHERLRRGRGPSPRDDSH